MLLEINWRCALRYPLATWHVPRKGRLGTESRLRVAGAPRCALRCPLSHVRVLLGGRRVTGSAITTQLAPRLRGWLRCVRGYDARIWRICDAAAALLFAADAVVVDAAAAAAASRSDGRPTDEGVLPECGGELDHFVSAKCAAWMYRMRRSSTFGKGARWVCALSLAGRAGCGAGSGIQTCAHGGKRKLPGNGA